MILGTVTPGGNTEPGPGGRLASAALPVVGVLLEGVALLCAGPKLESSLSVGASLVLSATLVLSGGLVLDAPGALALEPECVLLGLTELLADSPALAVAAELDAASVVGLAVTGPVSEVTLPLGVDVPPAGPAGDVSQASMAMLVKAHAAEVTR